MESESSVTAIEGEQRISKLPQEMKELIFGKLPFELSCTFRGVCKEWNSILSSRKFLASLPTQNPWLVMYDVEKNGNCNCVAYCFLAQKWRELSLSFLPHPRKFADLYRYEDEDYTLTQVSARHLSGTCQGLFALDDEPAQKVCVCNPLVRSYAEIEMDLTNKSIHIVAGGNREPYLVVCFNIKTFTFEIYHYFQDKWRRKLQFRDEGGDKNIVIEEMVECNGVLFWIAWPPALIIGYKIQDKGLISPVTVAPLPTQMVEDLSLYDDDEDLHVISVVSYGSSLLLVGIFRHNIPINNYDWISLFNGSRDHLGIVIWELYEDGEDHLLWKWREFARMPAQSLPQYLHPSEFTNWNCVCVGDNLCFNSLLGAKNGRVFTYNLREEVWQRLPPCKSPYFNMVSKSLYFQMASFEPNFSYGFL